MLNLPAEIATFLGMFAPLFTPSVWHHAQGLAIVHVDTTLLMERPQVGPHRAAIRSSLAAALGLPLEHVNVKASTGEGMGFVGRLEGAAALAVATVQAPGG